MTMPSKNRRNMRVAGVSYHYMVKRRDDIITIRIQEVESQKLGTVTIRSKFMVVKPGHIKAMILANDDPEWTNYLEDSLCKCGNESASPVKNMCAFDIEIRYDHKPPHYCRCCTECRDRCADDI